MAYYRSLIRFNIFDIATSKRLSVKWSKRPNVQASKRQSVKASKRQSAKASKTHSTKEPKCPLPDAMTLQRFGAS